MTISITRVTLIVVQWTMALCLLSPISSNAAAPAYPTKSPSTPSASSVLPAEDARLNRPISLDEVGTPLKAVLNKISRKGLILTADRTCAAQKLHLRLKQRPLRTLMSALAQLLPGQWEQLEEKQGYRLTMQPSAVRRRTEWWRLFLGERERALAEMRSQVLQSIRKVPYRRRLGDPNPENSDPALEKERADGQDFLRALPEALQEQIANQMLDFPYYNLLGNSPIGFYEETATIVPLSALSLQAKESLQNNSRVQRFAAQRSINWDEATLRFNNQGFAVMVSLAQANGAAVSTQELIVGNPPKALMLLLDQTWLAEEVQKMGKKAPATWKQLADYHKSRVWKNAPPSKKPEMRPRPRRVDALQRLGSQGDIEFVSDYYSLPGSLLPQEEKPAPLTRPLTEELAVFALEYDSSWKLNGDNLYLFRDNRWYREDNLEVPAEYLQEWYAPEKGRDPRVRRMNAAKVPSAEEIRQRMDWMAEVVMTLNLWQICNGLLYFSPETPPASPQKKSGIEEVTPFRDLRDSFPFHDDVTNLLQQYRTVLFYASLAPTLRAALAENRLPYIALNAAQQQEAIALLSVKNPAAIKLLTPRTLLGLKSNVGKEVLNYNNLPRLRLQIASVQ
jgi:hypothetical protein